MAWRHAAGVALVMATVGTSPAHALGPSWGYAEYFRLSGSPHFDESGYGDAARLSVPLGEFLYFNAAYDRIDAQYDSSPVAERFTVGTGGFGLHTTARSAHLFALVNYAEKSRVQYAPISTSDHVSGVGFAVGIRWLATPYLSVEPQGGLKGYYLDGFQKLTVAARLLPHVWATGEFSHNVIHGNEWLAGLRITWSDYTPTTRPSATLVGTTPDDMLDRELAVGETLVTLCPVVPQMRPALGAPEMAPLPKDTRIVLQENISNEFGTWWRVEVEGQSAWIRETDLKGRR